MRIINSFKYLFISIFIVQASTALSNQYRNEDANQFGESINELHLDPYAAQFYWGQDFIKTTSGYVLNVGKYTVDLANYTYNKFSYISKYFTDNKIFESFVLELYSIAKDEIADAAINAALGTLASMLIGTDPTSITGNMLDETAKAFVGELAEYLGVKEVPDKLAQKAYQLVKSFKK